MAFITSKLEVQVSEAVILVIDDVFKMVIVIYNLITQVSNANKKRRYASTKFQW